MKGGQQDWLGRGTREHSGVMEMISIWAMIYTRVCVCVCVHTGQNLANMTRCIHFNVVVEDAKYTSKENSIHERDKCTPMFIAALFIIARTWKQPRCPSADEWIRKLWYIYTMEYYSAIKKNSFESVLMRWMKLEPIIQSEVSQKDKRPLQYTNTYIWNLERW